MRRGTKAMVASCSLSLSLTLNLHPSRVFSKTHLITSEKVCGCLWALTIRKLNKVSEVMAVVTEAKY